MSIQVTMTFANVDALLAHFAKAPVNTVVVTSNTATAASPAAVTATTAAEKVPAPAPAPKPTPAPAPAAPAVASSAPEAPAASTASSTAPVSFDDLKRAFLALSTKEGGRDKCTNVLAKFGAAKLSAVDPSQHAACMAAIQEAAA